MQNSNRQQFKVIISGGGTGGHIFPAIAIANALKEKANPEILFIGAIGRMEMEKVPDAGYRIEGLWISGLQRRITWKNISFPFKVISSLMKARSIIRTFNPDVVIGVGGYASGPTLRSAIRMNIPTLIQEQNSYPGITNKLLAKSVGRICVAYEGMEKYFPKEKIVLTGNPVRKEVINITGKREKAAKYFGLESNKKTVLVVGGSQGALAINKGIHANLEKLVKDDRQLIWQTGKMYFEPAREAASRFQNVCVKEFIDRMDLAYAFADMIVSRAGAIAISEICATGVPPVFVPLPTAAEDHQTKNAQALVGQKAALLIRNNETEEKLGTIIPELLQNKELQKELRENLLKLAKTDATDRIAEEVIKLVKQA